MQYEGIFWSVLNHNTFENDYAIKVQTRHVQAIKTTMLLLLT